MWKGTCCIKKTADSVKKWYKTIILKEKTLQCKNANAGYFIKRIPILNCCNTDIHTKSAGYLEGRSGLVLALCYHSEAEPLQGKGKQRDKSLFLGWNKASKWWSTHFKFIDVREEEEDEAEGRDPLEYGAGQVEGVVLKKGHTVLKCGAQ